VFTGRRWGAALSRLTAPMKTGDFKLWRSPAVCWWLFGLFSILSVLWQIFDIKPYPEMERDRFILTSICGVAAVLFVLLGVRATKQRRP
jgi:hypothetical protein